MPVETGNLSRLAYIQEATFGTTPATPTGQIVRQTGFELTADRNYIDNTELRVDAMVPTGRGGALRGKGSISGKLSYGTYDPFFAAAMGMYDFNTNVIKINKVAVSTAATIAIAASPTNTFTRADGGSFVTDGFVVGDWIVVSGSTADDGVYLLSNVAALILTASTATGLTLQSASASIKIARSTRPSFTMEKQHLINGFYFPFLGCVVEGFSISGKVNQAVEVKFDLVTKSVGTESGTSLFTTTTAGNTNPLVTAWEGTVKKDTVALANVVGWDIKVSRNLDVAEVVGSSVIYDIQPKATKVTGTMELYFASYDLYTAMRSETDVALQLNLGPGGTKSYTVDLTLVRIKKWTAVPKDGLMTATVEFESFVPASGTNTSFMFTRLP